MNSVMFRSFVKEAMAIQNEDIDTPPDYLATRALTMRKLAMGNIGTAASLAGLGILAAPSIQDLRHKPMDEKKKAKYELAGLGAIAAPEAHDLYHGVRGSGVLSRLRSANPARLLH